MEKLKRTISIIIAVIAAIMVCITYPNNSASGWIVALVGWLEVINYQRNIEK